MCHLSFRSLNEDTRAIHGDNWYAEFYDERGKLLPEYRESGILRKMKLKFIRFTQNDCSQKFRNGAGYVEDLMGDLEASGDVSVLKGNVRE